jgi:hypothetical protein
LIKQIELLITGGPSVSCFAAANAFAIFVGTSTSTSAVKVSKADYSQTTVGGFTPPIPVTSITADNRGYVSVNFGSGNNTGFELFGPNGPLWEDGGGTAILLNQQNAYKP